MRGSVGALEGVRINNNAGWNGRMGEVAHQWHRGGQLLTCANDCERQSPSQQVLRIVILCSQIRPYPLPQQKKLVLSGQHKRHDIT